jgi:hypothetical protein
LAAVAEETRVLRCMRSLGAFGKEEEANVESAGIAFRRENCSCDASIGAIKTRWRAEAVLNSHLALYVLNPLRCPEFEKVEEQGQVKSSLKALSRKN